MPPGSPRRGRGRSPRRWRTIAIVSILALVVLAVSLRGIATFYTDFLWFRSLGLTDVWRNVLGARFVLAGIFIGVFFVLCWVNLLVANRLAPVFRPPGPEEELLAPYQQFIATRGRWIRLVVSGLLAVIAGAGVSGRWNDWLLFTNRVDFGIKDPQFQRDIGFYVFQLPFLSFVVNWLFFSLVVILFVTAIAHYLNGGIRFQTPGERVSPQVKAHLSMLLGVLALVRAADYWLDRYELTTSTRGVVDGATYTDVNVQLPALHLLVLISLLSFVLLLINIRRRGWQLPAVTVGLWAFVAIVAGNIYPAVVQRFNVEPAESDKERAYIERNIAATREAFGLADLEVRSYDYRSSLEADDIRANFDMVEVARILDPEAIRGAFQLEEGKRAFYQFPRHLDVDRYRIEDETRPVVIGARELNTDEQSGWESQHLAFTHGHGVAMADASEVSPRGLPRYVISDLPPVVADRLDVRLGQPQIYFGENLGGYAIVNADGRDEVDYTDDADREIRFRYDGADGVQLGSVFRRAAFSLRLGAIEPLISNFVSSDSRVIFNRDVDQRVRTIAPFLTWDSDPHPVLFGGRIVYVLDGYTTTDRYPYAQRAEGGLGSLSGGGFNYVRNSVKAVVDAYDGTVSFYVMPVDDPIIEAYEKAFPDLFTPYEEMPPGLREHLRYPKDIFGAQTTMWSRYHVAAPAELLSRSREWAVAQDAPRLVSPDEDGTTETTAVDAGVDPEARVPPYYQLARLPGEDELSFVQVRSFVAHTPDDTLKQLTGFMMADSSGDPDRYGRLSVYEMTNTSAPGPAAVAGNISAKREISQLVSLLNQQGSTVEYGDLLLLPMEDSILYVRPMFVLSRDTNFPALQAVVVSVGEQVEFGGSLQEALENLFGEDFSDEFRDAPPPVDLPVDPADPDAPPEDGEPPAEPPDTTEPPGEAPEGDVAELRAVLAELLQKQAEADAALREADLSTYGEVQAEIRELLDRAAELAGVPVGGTATPPEDAVPTAGAAEGAGRPGSVEESGDSGGDGDGEEEASADEDVEPATA